MAGSSVEAGGIPVLYRFILYRGWVVATRRARFESRCKPSAPSQLSCLACVTDDLTFPERPVPAQERSVPLYYPRQGSNEKVANLKGTIKQYAKTDDADTFLVAKRA